MDNNILGSMVIVKFFNNLSENNNSVITRTLKKIGVVDRNYTSNEIPKDGELWKVKIVKEICEHQNKGCFILEPIEKVDSEDIVKLFPGMYNETVEDKILFVYPKNTGNNWILPLEIKRKLAYRAVIVKLN